jgi:hypothetical protein
MSDQYGGKISDNLKEDVRMLLRIKPNEHAKIYNAINELKKKHNSQKIVDEIVMGYKELMEKIQSKSIKIKDKILKKHPYASSVEYIDLIKRYARKYDFEDPEIEMVIKLILYEKNVPLHGYDLPYTPLSKALGYVPQNFSYTTGSMTVEGQQIESLNAILEMNKATKELHAQITLQSLVYTPFDETSMVKQMNSENVNLFSYVHPVIAALFIPKITLLEERMLLASIAKIISNRKDGIPIQMQPEVELYEDICRDPVSSQCSSSTDEPFTDLLNRANVQIQLWNSVLNLRQGKYYIPGMTTFLTAIDKCKNNEYDAPEFTYVKDIGTIVQKLFGSFSLRPIIVTTETIPTLVSNNIVAMGNTMGKITAPVITCIPMIIVRIPENNIVNSISQKVDLKDTLVSQQTYGHGNVLERRTQKVHSCREVLMFYVPRRSLMSQTYKYANQYTIKTLPVSTTALEKLNDTNVFVPNTIDIGTDKFNLRSVVVVETKTSQLLNGDEIIVGCGAIVIPPNQSIPTDNIGFYYSPLCLFEQKNNVHINPIGVLPFDVSYDNTPSCVEYAAKNGTVYVYHAERADRVRNFGLSF